MVKEKFLSVLSSFNLVSPNDSILLAVSGGVDSIVMLDLFWSCRNDLKLSLVVAHYNHKQRSSADDDERFVYNYCKELGLTCVVGRLTQSLPKGVGKESAMRKLRYEFLLNSAKKFGIKKIAFAHNLDDQAETIIMNILRGSGMQGLRGMPIKRKLEGDVFIIRPLIFIQRVSIEDYARKRGLYYRIDESNFSLDFFRNRIRLELLPLLEKEYNKKIKERLVVLSEIIEKDFDFVYSTAKSVFEDLCFWLNKKEFFLSREALLNLHPSLLRQVFRIAVEALVGDTNRLNFRHYLEFKRMLECCPEGTILDIPKGVSIEKKRKMICFYLRKERYES